MTLNEKINMARKIQKHVSIVSDVWPGFTPVPFILYDDESQVAVGDRWPDRYAWIYEDIWKAEGTDPLLMGCTAIQYDGHLIAIWDTRNLSDNPSVKQITAGIAHEMFHCFQITNLKLPFPNELLRPKYPHSQRSVALVIEENKILVKMISERDPILLRKCLEAIADLRKQREVAIGSKMFAYDNGVESMEGTATYLEMCMIRNMGENSNTIHDALPLLTENNRLLAEYRLRCMASGAVLCLAADILCPGWQSEWSQTNLPIFDWLKQKFNLENNETVSNAVDLQTADSLISSYQKNNELQINAFLNQPLLSFDDGIELVSFDPLNLICYGNYCLHTRAGKICFGKTQILLERPFLTEIGDYIIDVKRVLIPESYGLTI